MAKSDLNPAPNKQFHCVYDAACPRVSFPGQRHTLRTIEAEFVARDPDPVLRIDIP